MDFANFDRSFSVVNEKMKLKSDTNTDETEETVHHHLAEQIGHHHEL